MTRNGVPVRWGRSIAAAGAAAAVLVGLVLAATAVLGGAGGAPVGWALLCCVPGAGLEGALLRTTPRHRAVLIVTVVAALVAGAVVWSGGAALLAAITALTCVPVVIANALELSSRTVRVPALVFRVLVAVGLIGVLPTTDTAAVAFWTVAAAAATTALTIRAVHSLPASAPANLRP